MTKRYVASLVALVAIGCSDEQQILPTNPTTNSNTNTSSSDNNTTIIVVIPNPTPAPTNPTTPTTPTTPGTPPGGSLTLPTYGQGVVLGLGAANPTLVQQSCVATYGLPAWRFLDLVVDSLRLQDARWGYVCRDPACSSVGEDVISYYPGTGTPTNGSVGVYVVDIIESYCLTPRVGYLNQGLQLSARWSNRGRF